MGRRLLLVAIASVFWLMLPSAARAQSSIAGVVRDTSGAVLPGVTVEAASPALIEKTRSAVTDGSGQYRIVDIRPGLYAVTFSLGGFATVKREAVELMANFTASMLLYLPSVVYSTMSVRPSSHALLIRVACDSGGH